jgi:uncharacterized protein (UPF0332 family)
MDGLDFQTVFVQAWDLWFLPEVERRQAAGTVPKPYEFTAGQVLFHADERGNEIRLNSEVKAVGKVKLKDGVSKEKGEWISQDEVEHWEALQLPETEDPNCGHFTVLRLGPHWHMFFDFIYNKGHSRVLLETAREFLAAAQHALTNNHLRSFADTLFSASELAATALLVTVPIPGTGAKFSHGGVHSRFNLFAKLGNVAVPHRESFNTLAAARSKARYHNGPYTMTRSEAEGHLASIQEFLQQVQERVTREQ